MSNADLAVLWMIVVEEISAISPRVTKRQYGCSDLWLAACLHYLQKYSLIIMQI